MRNVYIVYQQEPELEGFVGRIWGVYPASDIAQTRVDQLTELKESGQAGITNLKVKEMPYGTSINWLI